MRTIRHREVKWHDQDQNTNNEQNQNPDEVYSTLCPQPALCQGRKIGGTLGGGPTIRKTLTSNPKVAQEGTFIYA